MRILTILSILILFTGCGIFDDCEVTPTNEGPTIECHNDDYETTSLSRLVNCSNAGNGYSLGQPNSNAIRNLQIDSVYCDANGIARVAASFYPHSTTQASWYDVNYVWLNSFSMGQTVDYVLPTDMDGNSIYYAITLTATPNATHPNQNSMQIVETRSFY